ncbi:hypothetical protein XENOCAPTIV_028914, partial [Xenoophorus captivus]
RNARHLGEEEDPLTQCVRQGDSKDKFDMKEVQRTVSPVLTGDQLVVIERGVLIRRAELSHGGVYHCQVEEHGYHWTAVSVRLAVWSPSANRVLASLAGSSYQSTGTQPWYEDVMALIHPGNLGEHCKALGYRPPRNQRHRGDFIIAPHKEKVKAEKHMHGGGGGGRAVGRKSRSKPQQRAPRSA